MVVKKKKNRRESMCGGQYQKALDTWEELLEAFKATDCKLVFIADSNLQENKIDKWLCKRNSEFNKCTKFYDAISNEEIDLRKCIELFPSNPLRFLLYGMAVITGRKIWQTTVFNQMAKPMILSEECVEKTDGCHILGDISPIYFYCLN